MHRAAGLQLHRLTSYGLLDHILTSLTRSTIPRPASSTLTLLSFSSRGYTYWLVPCLPKHALASHPAGLEYFNSYCNVKDIAEKDPMSV